MDQITCKKNLEQFIEEDCPIYPAYSFLLKEVVAFYGICPFLQLEHIHSRNSFLTKDSEETYRRVLDELESIPLKEELDALKDMLKLKVSETIPDFERLVELVRIRTGTSTLNKTLRLKWSETLQELDEISQRNNFDFLKFTKIVYGLTIRHKCIYPGKSEISELIENFNRIQIKSDLLLSSNMTDKKEAMDRLSELVNNGFKIDQVGKYFKKWSSLTPDKKTERIRSYCEWFLTQNQISIGLIDTLMKFIEEKIGTKEIKTSDIVWNSKRGIILKINVGFRLSNESNESNESSESDESEKSGVIFHVIVSLKVNQKKRSRTTTGQDTVIDSMIQRLNRLLLFEILKGNALNKQKIVETVLGNVSIQKKYRDQVTRLLNKTYDEMTHIISENPMK